MIRILHHYMKATMRKGFSVALVAMILAGASITGARAETTEISMYYPVAVGGEVAGLVNRLVADFENENSGIRVKPIYSGTYKEALAKALTAHKSGAPPTLAVLFAADMYTLIDADTVLPFESLVQSAEDRVWLGGFQPAFMVNSVAAEKTWGIPFQRSTILLYWNKALFRAAGLDPARPPVNWAEMTDYAQKLTHRDATGQTVQWGLQIPSSGFPYWLFQGLAVANGQRLMNAAGTETYFDRPAVIKALEYWVDLSRRHKVHPPGIVEWGATPGDFLKKKVAMIWTTSGNLENIKKNASFDFGVAMLPASKRRGSPTGGGNFYVFKKSTEQQQQAALKFVKWITSPKRAAQWSIDTGYIAVRPDASNTPEMKAYAEHFPMSQVGLDQLQYAVAEFSTHENQRVTKALNRGLVAALTGEKSPEQAMKDAQADAVRILRPYMR